MKRPPTPIEVLPHSIVHELGCKMEDEDEMQEALTAEYFIEYGLMPDPTEFPMTGTDWVIGIPEFESWECEDKTK